MHAAPLSTLRSNRFLIGKQAVEVLLSSAKRPGETQTIDTGFEIIAGKTA
jgi:LacI family transcriptional regulator, gluconate utilization system Gnt-I transcriptional repressor